MNTIESPKHSGTRKFLRIAGPLILAIGALLEIIGIGSFMASVNNKSWPPALFVCAFIGIPALFIGAVMCMFAFLGAFTRYLAAEQAPVAKDTINYLADGTQEAVKTVARAAAQGVAEGIQSAQTKSTELK